MRTLVHRTTGLAMLAVATCISCGASDSDPVLELGENSQALGSFALTVLSTDATSVKLRWTPVSGASEYVVSRNGTPVGSTISKTGYFSDFGLQIARVYQYSVTALDANGVPLAVSSTASATTKTSTAVRTRYKVLALAFNPNGDSLVPERAYLKHRVDFLKLASAGSANIEFYGGGLLASSTTPATYPGNSDVDYMALVKRRDLPGLGGLSIVDLVENGSIDHVWVVKSPIAMFGENALMGNRPIQGDGLYVPERTWDPIPVKCSRSFFVNSYEPDERAWDAYAHMVEGIMTSVTDGHPENFPRAWQYTVYTTDRSSFATTTASLNLFERFRLGDEWTGGGAYASPGNGNCGTSHFPPTTPRSTEDYAYWDPTTWQRYIDSPADDWLLYPAFNNAKRKLNGYDYGAYHDYALDQPSIAAELAASASELHPSFTGSSTAYHQWWFWHLPHNPGTSDGKLNNWWPYLYDFNRFDGTPINYAVSGAPAIPTTFNPVNAEYGTELASAAGWGYWHSQNGFSPGAKSGQVTLVSRTQSPSNVKRGSYAIKVAVENAQYWEEAGTGRNDVFYPATRNAHWSLRGLKTIKVSIKPGLNPALLTATNPIIRLYKNGGTRIELVPTVNGAYANLFADPSLRDANGWYNFVVPVAGSTRWEKNVIGYIDPSLSGAARQQARADLEQAVLLDVNYVEVSVRSLTTQTIDPTDLVSYYIDDLELLTY